jgi:hypothetical protein
VSTTDPAPWDSQEDYDVMVERESTTRPRLAASALDVLLGPL